MVVGVHVIRIGIGIGAIIRIRVGVGFEIGVRLVKGHL